MCRSAQVVCSPLMIMTSTLGQRTLISPDNTFFVINRPGNMLSGRFIDSRTRNWRFDSEPAIQVLLLMHLIQYPAGAFEVVPVLNIDLSSANHFNEVLATVNRNLVEINGTLVQEQIFPKLELDTTKRW